MWGSGKNSLPLPKRSSQASWGAAQLEGTPAPTAGDGGCGWQQRKEVGRREDRNVETFVRPPSLGTWLPLTSPREAGMFEKAGLLQPRSGLSELAPHGRVACLGRALGCLGLSGSPGLDLLLQLLAGIDAPFPHFPPPDRRAHSVAWQRGPGRHGGVASGVYSELGVREGPHTGANPFSHLYPSTNFVFIFVPIFKVLFPKQIIILREVSGLWEIEQEVWSSHLLPHPQFSLLTSCVGVVRSLQLRN